MTTTLDNFLAEAQRDALVTGYKTFVVPKLNGVTDTLSDEDMYEYLLLDMDMSGDSMTSRLSSAIDSLQTYLSRIINNSEPGHVPPVASIVDDWRTFYCRYDIWAAGHAVVNYPNNYLSPVTRQDTSQYFENLKNTLNQNQLDSDRVMDAALAYLNEFEGVSNLEVINGYITQVGMTNDGGNLINDAQFYFIGRTTTKPYQYYWRMMDLSKNQGEPGGKPVTPNCWNDWTAIDLPLAGGDVVGHTIRPAFFNNRLYLCWATRDATPRVGAGTNFLTDEKNNPVNDNLAMDGTEYYAWGLSYAYLRFDGKWTAPNIADMVTSATILDNDGNDDDDIALSGQLLVKGNDEGSNQRNVVSLFVRDATTGEGASRDIGATDKSEYGRLLMSLAVHSSTENVEGSSTYAYRYGDSAFNRLNLASDVRTLLFSRFASASYNKNPLQYTISLGKLAYRVIAVEPLEKQDHKNDAVDVGNMWFNALKDLEVGDLTVDSASDILTVNMSTTAQIAYIKYVASVDATNYANHCFEFRNTQTDERQFSIRYDPDSDVWRANNTKIISNNNEAVHPPIEVMKYCEICNTKLDTSLFPDADTIDINPDAQIGWSKGEWGTELDVSGARIHPAYLKQDALWKNFGFNGAKYFYSLADLSHTGALYDAIQEASQPIADWQGQMGGWIARVKNNNPEQTENLQTWRDDKMNIIPEGHTYRPTHAISASDFQDGSTSLQYVIQVLYKWDNQGDVPAGYVSKNFLVTLESFEQKTDFTPPSLVKRYDSKKGMVQKLAFNDNILPADTRLNTTFVRELIAQASNGLGSLLNYALQSQELEADLDADGKSAHIDFNGANGLYFWELFFHLPFMVAWRLASEQQLDEAQTWLHYIFDPSVKDKTGGAPDYWNCYPITLSPEDSLALSRLSADPINPDTQAYADPELYKKAVFMAYASNLIALGDTWYRQLTRDTLAQARVLYNQASTLLGPRPDTAISHSWTPKALSALTDSSSALRAHEHLLPVLRTTALPALRAANHGTLRDTDNAAFTAPLNSALLGYWDTLDARLYNLRHNLTVDGKPMNLALYATPADPTTLLAQRAQNGTLTGGVSGAQLVVPPYRFSAVLPRAYSAVSTLCRFGESLLSLLERSERAGQEELAQQQLLDMSSYVLTLQQQSIDGLMADRTALQVSLNVAEQRRDYYGAHYDENISPGEQLVMDLRTSSQSLILGAQAFHTAGGALQMVPTVFGMACGSFDPGAATDAIGTVMTLSAGAMDIDAGRQEQAEGYRRRREEWGQQRDQADGEALTLSAQLDALEVRIQAAQTALDQEVTRQAQTQAMLTYLKNRFTQATLYQWLSGQLSALYYQAYDAVVSLCLSAQACWQYEIGDFTTAFIQTGAWNDHYRGLLVGETLQLNLQQMEAAWLARNERRLNIVRTVSLKDLVKSESAAWEKFKNSGTLDFTLNEALFDNDYAGHYLRTLKTVTVTLPTLLGPYQDVKATLTQTDSSTVLKASVDAVDALINGDVSKAPPGTLVRNLRASQQVALSGGLNDAGTFELQFSDERYLPFEGTGAVSGWTLSFPRVADEQVDGKTLKADAQQKALLDALDDVIVQVHYTACDGGATFADKVKSLIVGS